MNWILVLFIHVGAVSDSNNLTMTSVPGFRSEAACQAAGVQSQDLVKRTTKNIRYVCLKQE